MSPERPRWHHNWIGDGGCNQGRLPRGGDICSCHWKNDPTGCEEVRLRHPVGREDKSRVGMVGEH